MSTIQYPNSSPIFTHIHENTNCSTAQPHQYVFEDFCAKLIPRPDKSDTQYIVPLNSDAFFANAMSQETKIPTTNAFIET